MQIKIKTTLRCEEGKRWLIRVWGNRGPYTVLVGYNLFSHSENHCGGFTNNLVWMQARKLEGRWDGIKGRGVEWWHEGKWDTGSGRIRRGREGREWGHRLNQHEDCRKQPWRVPVWRPQVVMVTFFVLHLSYWVRVSCWTQSSQTQRALPATLTQASVFRVPAQVLCGLWGSKFQSSLWQGKQFIHWALAPTAQQKFEKRFLKKEGKKQSSTNKMELRQSHRAGRPLW